MPIPIISVTQMREWEQASWAAGRNEQQVISEVGRIVAQRALKMSKAGDRILILCGKGHNGDDARRAQPHLAGRHAKVLYLIDPVEGIREIAKELAQQPTLIIDGLFGIGLNRPLTGGWMELVNLVNRANVPVLAVDVPSGLHADTGQTSRTAIKAAVTLTLGAPKLGLVTTEAASWTGRVEVAPEIGLIPCPCKGELNWTLAADFAGFPPARAVNGHKGTFGHLVIVAGSLGYHGAAVMAARAALRAMPGLVSLLTPQNVYVPVAGQLDSAMVHPLRLNHPLLEDCDAILAGPGMAARDLPAETAHRVNQLWRSSPIPMVLDASALDWLQAGPVRFPDLRVITPHPGEAARLLKQSILDVQADRVKAVRELSRAFGNCWVVLKGHQTLVGKSAGEIFFNSSGNPGLAQGGTGDVLAGYLSGLLAQPELREKNMQQTIRHAVWQHGATADQLAARQNAWTVANLIAGLGNAPAAE